LRCNHIDLDIEARLDLQNRIGYREARRMSHHWRFRARLRSDWLGIGAPRNKDIALNDRNLEQKDQSRPR
jgi:hypothetical protein